jgi:hypothetical protein
MRLKNRSKHDELPATPPKAVAQHRHIDDLSVNIGGKRLGELLVDAQLTSREQIVEALQMLQESGGKRLGELLIEVGSLYEHDLASMLATQHAVELVDLRDVLPDVDATNLLSEQVARELTVIPLSVRGDTVVVAAADPSSATASLLRASLGKQVTLMVAVVDTRISTSRPSMSIAIWPSCGRRRSTIFMPPRILIRLTTAGPIDPGRSKTSCRAPSTR